MSEQKVSTERLAEAAARIRRTNDDLDQAFEALAKKMRSSLDTWNSAAGEKALWAMDDLIQIGSDSRSAVLRQYAEALDRQIAANYSTAETHNSKLADQFMD